MSRNMHADMAAVDGRRRLNMDKLMTVICFILLFIIVIIPIFMIIYNAFFFEGKFELNMFVTQLTDSKNLAAMWNTLKIALFATVFGTIMGVFYAWLLGRSDIPCKGLMRALFVVFVLASLLIAWGNIAEIVTLMSMSWGTVAGCIMGPYIYGVTCKRTTKVGAAAGFFSGLLVAIVLTAILGTGKAPFTGCMSMLSSMVVTPIVSMLTPKLPSALVKSAFGK